MRVLVLGNPLIPEDSLPLRLIGRLRKKFPKIEFVEFDPNEDIEEEGAKGFVAIDAVYGIRKVRMLTNKDIGRLELPPSASMHDFDLALDLKILAKMGMLGKVRILGIPPEYPEKKALAELARLLPTLSSGSGRRSSCKGRRRVSKPRAPSLSPHGPS